MAQSAESLHCPNCGGPAAPGDAVCKYCHAPLATVSCPSCFGLMFEGAIYCPQCGARRARVGAGDRTAPCPSCKGTMHDVEIGATGLLECEKCRGTWIDAETFERLCKDGEAQATVLHRWPAVERRAVETTVRYRPCVTCRTMMNRLNFGKISGTVVDVCKGHGTFLDAGELHQIMSFIQGGGLERARARQIQDLQEEERTLRGLQSAAINRPIGEALRPGDFFDAADIFTLLRDLTH
jgi:Zn-finger nucleic acid-binding protein